MIAGDKRMISGRCRVMMDDDEDDDDGGDDDDDVDTVDDKGM